MNRNYKIDRETLVLRVTRGKTKSNERFSPTPIIFKKNILHRIIDDIFIILYEYKIIIRSFEFFVVLVTQH